MAGHATPLLVTGLLKDCLSLDKIDELLVLKTIDGVLNSLPGHEAFSEHLDELIGVQTGLCARILTRIIEQEVSQVS